MKTFSWFFLALALGIGYIVWLDAGCGALGGVITWEGKQCLVDY